VVSDIAFRVLHAGCRKPEIPQWIIDSTPAYFARA
jgi:hypothetical protein